MEKQKVSPTKFWAMLKELEDMLVSASVETNEYTEKYNKFVETHEPDVYESEENTIPIWLQTWVSMHHPALEFWSELFLYMQIYIDDEYYIVELGESGVAVRVILMFERD